MTAPPISILAGGARAAVAALALWPASSPASAQHKPYEPLAVAYDRTAETDASLKALIETLRAAVAQNNLAAVDAVLSPALIAYDCDADPAKPCPENAIASSPAPVKITGIAKPVRATRSLAAKADARVAALLKLPPPQRLRAGLCCRDVPARHISKTMREEAVLGFVGAALEEETLGAHPDLPGSVCMPAAPVFDRAKAAQIAASADVETGNLRVATVALTLRAKPARDAEVTAIVASGQAVAFVTDAPEALPDGWSSIALPQGGVGFTDQGGLTDLTPAGLCFAKDDAGNWKISAAVQRHS